MKITCIGLLKSNGLHETRRGSGWEVISMRLFFNKLFLMPFFLYWVVMVSGCFAQSSLQHGGALESLGGINTSGNSDHGKAGTNHVEASDSSMVIFKENIDRSASSGAWLSDRPLQNFGLQGGVMGQDPSKIGIINQGYMGTFNTPNNNPRGVSIGISAPIGSE
ncbi:hypothetical protein [Polynucleobacter sp. es-MAR-4]|uniref:hypothetical protein n=1 Tax=Polynucleobacter sp. es-MAR-4 TaxID=1855655 RepID=UPI001C0C4F74|nr:hypothetical protein [Polynucleobacter sp. es-MAR-4]MBU3636079.1 hypothetical protein [Polynucleobacter sp. es-MAR-4]